MCAGGLNLAQLEAQLAEVKAKVSEAQELLAVLQHAVKHAAEHEAGEHVHVELV